MDPLNSPPAKKTRLTTDFTRRKRAAIACGFCRLRKTKCDNQRPSCSFCLKHKAKCVYNDGDEVDALTDAGGSSVIGQQILERLDEIKALLQTSTARVDPGSGDLATSTPFLHNLLNPADPSGSWESGVGSRFSASMHVGSPMVRSHAVEKASGDTPENEKSPYSYLRCESVLQWPVFQSVVLPEDAQITSFPSAAASTTSQDSSKSFKSAAVPDDQFVPLCHRFLSLVHHRNPILRPTELMRMARDVQENGLKWNPDSCLVLLACAIAAYTRPWEKPLGASSGNLGTAEHPAPLEDEPDKTQAEAYYLAAKKRLGLLGHSTQDIECFFYAHMYEKIALRPIDACIQIQAASCRLQAHLLSRRDKSWTSNQDDSPTHHLEQRLFWSCFRAESEILVELDFRSTGLENLPYPDAFPVPPQSLLTRPDSASPDSSHAAEDVHLQEQRSWAYYLAEISLRRTIDATVRLVYAKGETEWLKSPAQLVRQYRDLEQQISSWMKHLPVVIYSEEESVPNDELTLYLQSRFLEWREYVLRPILYYALHAQSTSISDEVLELAHKCIKICSECINRYTTTYRHGGTWFGARRHFLYGMLILSVIFRSECGVKPVPQWQYVVGLALRNLRYWGQDSADINLMASVLYGLYERACRDK